MAKCNYVRGALIGKGTYGEVYVGEETVSGKQVALKRLDTEKYGITVDMLREVEAMVTLQHPNILPLLNVRMAKVRAPGR